MSEVKKSVVLAGVRFLQAITETYGGNEGVDLFEKLREALPEEVSDAIFAASLTGCRSEIKVYRNQFMMDRFIECIREIRRASGMGLKEAKEFVEYVRDYGPKTFDVDPDNYDEVFSVLRKSGLNVE